VGAVATERRNERPAGARRRPKGAAAPARTVHANGKRLGPPGVALASRFGLRRGGPYEVGMRSHDVGAQLLQVHFFNVPFHSSPSSCTVFFVNSFHKSSLYSPARIAWFSLRTRSLSYFSLT
jgi:hypothetical protein